MNNQSANSFFALRLSLLSVFLAPVFALAQGSLTPPGSPAPTMRSLDQIEPRTAISLLPFNITNPGSYYVTGDLTGAAGTNGISILANDVALDLRGFTLRGVPGAGSGILVAGNRTNLWIHSGVIRDWPTNGIQASTAAQGHFQDLQLVNNGGIGLNGGSQSLVERCQSIGNGSLGIVIGFSGIVRDSVASRNVSHGFVLANSSSLITGCVANNNDDGIDLPIDSIARNCVVASNTNGIRTTSRCSVIECEVVDSVADGIVTSGNSLGLLLNNQCARNFGAGIHTPTGSLGTRIEGNNVVTNGIGIRVDSGSNLIIRNAASFNNTNYLIAAGNSVGPTNTAASILTNDNPNANFSF